jgi:hypothetical protein
MTTDGKALVERKGVAIIDSNVRMNPFGNRCEPKVDRWGQAALEQRRERTRDHLETIAPRRESWIKRNGYYYDLLNRLLRFLVEPHKKILSVRCGAGNLLSLIRPSDVWGIDICPKIVEIAKQLDPSFSFTVAFPDKDDIRNLMKLASSARRLGQKLTF